MAEKTPQEPQRVSEGKGGSGKPVTSPGADKPNKKLRVALTFFGACLGLLLIVVLIVSLSGGGDSTDNAAANAPTSSSQSTDSEAEFTGTDSASNSSATGAAIYVEGLEEVAVARTEEALQELTDAAIHQDEMGTEEIVDSDRAFVVPNNTKVLVIGRKFIKTKVRIMEGDYFGEIGWVPVEWVKE